MSLPLLNLFSLIPTVRKYLPLAQFLFRHGDKIIDLAQTSGKAVEAIEKTDPTIIPHLEELTKDLVKSAGPLPDAPDTHVAVHVAKHTVARALVRPQDLSANEKAWMDRASASES